MLETKTTQCWPGLAAAILCAVMLVFTSLPKVSADDWDKKTVITFGETVQIPGQALPAGTYVFKVMRLTGDGHVVQVFDQQEHKLFATLMAIPVYRDPSAGPERTAIRFEERLSSEPQAVKIWFRPGDTIGNEFVYSKNQSQLLAKNSPWAIPGTTATEVAQNQIPAQPNVGDLDSQAATTPSDTSTVATPSDTATEAEPTPAAEAPSPYAEEQPEDGTPQDATPAPATTTPDQKPDTLPKTGSELPLIGLIGSLSLVLGAGVSAYRRRSLR
jgi:LPXTG-motif cell wall-anchored protein